MQVKLLTTIRSIAAHSGLIKTPLETELAGIESPLRADT